MLGERGLEGLEGRDFPGIAYWEYLGCGNRLNLLRWIGLDWAGLGWGSEGSRLRPSPPSTTDTSVAMDAWTGWTGWTRSGPGGAGAESLAAGQLMPAYGVRSLSVSRNAAAAVRKAESSGTAPVFWKVSETNCLAQA